MYLALRDLRFARGRFALIVTVVALMTLLVGFLSGLTGGLASQNISSLLKLNVDRVSFGMEDGESPSYTSSVITAAQADAWRSAPDVERATPLGIATVLIEGPNGGRARDDGTGTQLGSATVALFGTDVGFNSEVPASPDAITLGEGTAAELGVVAGDTVTLAGRSLTVDRVVEPQEFSHRDVAWTQLATWQDYLADTRQPDAYASVLLLDGAPDVEAVDAQAGTTTQSFLESLLALEAFKSEIGSLGLMIAMLVAISVLVIGVFFLVWSMQRHRDIAVLKALGANSGWLAKDALGQAALVLIGGALLGTAATFVSGLLVAQLLPFVLSWPFLVAPPVGMVLAGLLGAMVSLRQITRVDPLTALGAAA